MARAVARKNEPIVLDLAQVIGEAMPTAGFKAVHLAALLVVIELRRKDLISEMPVKSRS